MGLAQKLSALKDRAEDQGPSLNTTDKTKNALLLPFFQMLGYDPFNVREVEPGPTVELGNGSSETVDYAVNIDGAPAMLFQCEQATAGREAFEQAPLLQGLDKLEATVVGLTNGLSYWFYTEVAAMGGTDLLPFLKIDLFGYESQQVRDLKRLTKSNFDADELLSLAFERQHTHLLQNYFAEQQEHPDEHFVRFLAAQIHEGGVSDDVLGRLQPVVQTFLEDVKVDRETSLPDQDLSGTSASVNEADLQSEVPSTDEDPQIRSHDGSPSTEESTEPDDSSTEGTSVPESSETENSEEEEVPEEPPENGDLQQETNIGKELARKVIGE
jgi:hypothetical protein